MSDENHKCKHCGVPIFQPHFSGMPGAWFHEGGPGKAEYYRCYAETKATPIEKTVDSASQDAVASLEEEKA